MEHRFHIDPRIGWRIPQVTVHRLRIDDLAAVKQVIRVPYLLHAAQELHHFRPDHPLDQVGPQSAVPMLAGERAPVRADQVGHFHRNRLHLFKAFRSFDIQNRTQVQLADRGMGVVDTPGVVSLHNFLEIGDVSRQVLDPDRGVVNKLRRVGIGEMTHKKSESGFSQIPYAIHLCSLLHDGMGVAMSLTQQTVLQGLGAVAQLLQVPALEFDKQERFRIALQEKAVAVLFHVTPGGIEDMFIHQFRGGRSVGHRLHGAFKCFLQGGELRDEQDFMLFHRHQLHHRLGDKRQGALTAAKQFAQIKRASAGCNRVHFAKAVDGVTRITSRNIRVGGLLQDEIAVFAKQCDHFPVDTSLQRIKLQFFIEFRFGERPEMRAGAVAKHDMQFTDMFAGRAVRDRIGSAGVITDHAAQHTTVGSRSIGSEEQSVRCGLAVKLITDDTRLDAREMFSGVDLQHPMHEAGDIGNDAASGSLAGQAGTGGPHGDRHLVVSCIVDQ